MLAHQAGVERWGRSSVLPMDLCCELLEPVTAATRAEQCKAAAAPHRLPGQHRGLQCCSVPEEHLEVHPFFSTVDRDMDILSRCNFGLGVISSRRICTRGRGLFLFLWLTGRLAGGNIAFVHRRSRLLLRRLIGISFDAGFGLED